MPSFRVEPATERDIAMPVTFGPSTNLDHASMDSSTSTSTGTRIEAAIVVEQWDTAFGPFTSLWQYGPNYWPTDWDGDFTDRFH